MTEPLVHVEGVGKRYPHFTLDDISFTLAPGGIMGFIGANGAGKSTTLRILMGLVHQDRGDVRLLGHAMPSAQAIAKRDVGFVSEDMRLFGTATLGWHMAFIQNIFPSWDPAYAEVLLRRFDLQPDRRIKG